MDGYVFIFFEDVQKIEEKEFAHISIMMVFLKRED